MRLTLDANCLTDLANGSERAAPIQALIDLHRAGTIQVFVSAVPAPGIPAITDLPSVLPAGRYEMSYWGAAVYGSEKDDLSDRDQIDRQLHRRYPDPQPDVAEIATRRRWTGRAHPQRPRHLRHR
jgi:hypothetical protein